MTDHMETCSEKVSEVYNITWGEKLKKIPQKPNPYFGQIGVVSTMDGFLHE